MQEAFEVARRAPAPARAAPRPSAAPAPKPRAFAYEGHGQQARGAGTAQVFRCAACGEAFPSRRRLRRHAAVEHDAGPEREPAAARGAGKCDACGWRNCQCAARARRAGDFDFEASEREDAAAARRRRSRRDAAPPPADAAPEEDERAGAGGAKRAWWARARGSSDVFDAPTSAHVDWGGGGGGRSSRRVVESQVAILRDMGFSRDAAEYYADDEAPLDAILDLMCADGVEFEEATTWSPLSYLASFLPRVVPRPKRRTSLPDIG